MEITGDAPEIGPHTRPRLPLVDDLTEVAAAGAAVAIAHLGRARLHDGALRGEASSRPRPWARQRHTASVDVALGELEGRVSHRAAGDGNCHLGRQRWQLVHGRLHQIRQRQVRQILAAAGLQPDHQRLLRPAGLTRCPICETKEKDSFKDSFQRQLDRT